MGSDDFDPPIDRGLIEPGLIEPGLVDHGLIGLDGPVPQERQVGWYTDPFGRHAQRWWDGTGWSERVRTDTGGQGIDPPGIDVAPVAVTESIPANPIEDALLPIKRGPIADKIALLVGCLVFLGLVAVFVVALTV